MANTKTNEEIYVAFERAFQNDGTPDLTNFLPDREKKNYTEVFTELARIELELMWKRGDRRKTDYYLARYPAELKNLSVLDKIAFEEYRQCRQHGIDVTPVDFSKRFAVDASQWPVFTNLDNETQKCSEVSTKKDFKTSPEKNISSEFDPNLSRQGSHLRDTDCDLLLGKPLQRRLRLVSICAASLFAYLLLLVVINPEEKVGLFLGSPLTIIFNFASLIVAAGFYVVLQLRRVSTNYLRRIELLLFGITLANFSLGYFSDVVLDHELIEPLAEGDHALFHYSSSWSLPFFALIIVYGTLIPSSLTRCLFAVCGIAIIPILISIIGVSFERGWSSSFVISFLLQMTIWMAIGISIATYGVTRINSLQRIIRKGGPLGSYKLGRLLNKGGMGEVYEATHTMLKRPCAVKVLHANYSTDEMALLRFEREVRTMGEINHPNIVKIFDFGRADDGAFFYVMEFLRGETLAQKVKRDGALEVSEALPVMVQTLEALESMHAHGVVHRDITPANIFLSQDGNGIISVKLIDFGLVQIQEPNPSRILTMKGAILGTPAFMSPEQASGSSIDWRSDIYSFAATSYFMLVGKPPFERPTVVETLNAHIREAITPIEQLRPQIESGIAEILNSCLAKDPSIRFDCTADIRKELQQATKLATPQQTRIQKD